MTLSDSLRRRSDDELAALLHARPDLLAPPPADFGVLARRAASRTSTGLALERLDAFRLQILEAIVLLGELDAAPVPYERLRAAAGCDVRAAVDELRALALVWGDDGGLRPADMVRDLVAERPLGLGRLAAALPLGLGQQQRLADPTGVAALVRDCDEPEREVLRTLAAGPPVGVLSSGPLDPRGSPTTPIGRLVGKGLLARLDATTVELPREVGLVLRGDRPLGTITPSPGRLEHATLDQSTVDKAGAAQVLETLRLVQSLLDGCASDPPGVLRAGGLGVRDLRRIARRLGAAEPTTALLVEVVHAAGLLDSHPGDAEWLPTPAYDRWSRRRPAQRWEVLARAWLDMSRLPGLVGLRDFDDRPRAALSGEVSRTGASELRGAVLDALASLPDAAAPSAPALHTLLAWRAPRRQPGSDLAAWTLAEAETLGLTGQGALTSYARALLAGGPGGAEVGEARAVAVLDPLLPEPIGHVLVQADLTIVVPGPLRPELAEELALVADLESAGGGGVYRISAQTIRRALDAGRSAADLHEFFRSRSRTAVPQALTYLVDDLARRHGSLRVGVAAYLRCDDAALLAELLVDRRLAVLRLRRIAPTVVVSPRAPAQILDALRGAGYAPVQESATGSVVLARAEARRTPPAPDEGRFADGPAARPAARPADERLAKAVASLRAAAAAAGAARPTGPTVTDGPAVTTVPSVTTATTLFLLHRAARLRHPVLLSYVDGRGERRRQVLVPLSVAGGYLRAEDRQAETLHTIALHRVSAAVPVGGPDDR